MGLVSVTAFGKEYACMQVKGAFSQPDGGQPLRSAALMIQKAALIVLVKTARLIEEVKDEN